MSEKNREGRRSRRRGRRGGRRGESNKDNLAALHILESQDVQSLPSHPFTDGLFRTLSKGLPGRNALLKNRSSLHLSTRHDLVDAIGGDADFFNTPTSIFDSSR